MARSGYYQTVQSWPYARLELIAPLVGAAFLAVAHASAAAPTIPSTCARPSPPPIEDPAAVPEDGLAEHLGVLRRAERSTDRSATQLRAGLSFLSGLDRIAVRSIRYLGRAPLGARFFLLPATIRDPFVCEPQRPRFEPFAAQIELRTHAVGAALAVVMKPNQHEAILYDEGALYEDVAANRVIAYFNAPGNRTATLAGVVPDGVRRVRVTYGARTTTVRVAGGVNFWATTVPAQHRGLNFRFVWLGTGGRVLGRFAGIDEAIY
jgi:hypothetical protein